jgi:hypothetical protein
MSLCFNHARRTFLPITTIRHTTASSTSITLPNIHQSHNFSTAKSKKKTEPTLSYADRKAAAKSLRRSRYEAHQARLERLTTRRDASPKDVKKNLFRSWFDNEALYHSHLVRTAKKEGKPWRVRVAAMVERLPVVTPDEPQWEVDYMELRAYLDTFGREYPPETGFMPPDKPEDHIIESNEEMIGVLLLIVVCCSVHCAMH